MLRDLTLKLILSCLEIINNENPPTDADGWLAFRLQPANPLRQLYVWKSPSASSRRLWENEQLSPTRSPSGH